MWQCTTRFRLGVGTGIRFSYFRLSRSRPVRRHWLNRSKPEPAGPRLRAELGPAGSTGLAEPFKTGAVRFQQILGTGTDRFSIPFRAGFEPEPKRGPMNTLRIGSLIFYVRIRLDHDKTARGGPEDVNLKRGD